MSDFLSNFTSDKYKKDAEEQELVTPDTEIPETAMENVTPDLSEVANYDAVSDDDVLADTTIRGLSCEMLDEETNAEDFNEITDVKNFNDTSEDKLDNENFNDVSDDELASFLRELADVSSEDDLVVKDQFFAKKQKIKRGIIAGSGLLAVIVIT